MFKLPATGKPSLSKQDPGTFPKVTKGVTFTLDKSEVHEIPAKPKRTPKVPWKCLFEGQLIYTIKYFKLLIGMRNIYIFIFLKKLERRSKSAPNKPVTTDTSTSPNRSTGIGIYC